MTRKNLLLCFLLAFCIEASQSQEGPKWTLQQCIEHAYDNNITVQQARIAQMTAQNNYQQARLDVLPSVNASAAQNFNFSNSVDPTTFAFINQNTRSNNFNLNGSLELFNGGAKISNIKKNQSDLLASEARIDVAQNDIALSITSMYLQVLLNREVRQAQELRLGLSKDQYAQTEILVDAGAAPEGQLLDLDAQVANDEVTLINAKNAEELSLLSLRLMLQLEDEEYFDLESPDLDKANMNPGALAPARDVYEFAILNQPVILASTYDKMSAERSLNLARSSLYPSIRFNANVGSNYFSASQQVVGEVNLGRQDIGILPSTSEVVTTIDPYRAPVFGDLSFGQQLEQNRSQTVSFSMSIPIFNQWQVRTTIANAKLNIERADLNINTQLNGLKESIYRAHADATAARESYLANARNVEAQKRSFEYAKTRLEVGAINLLDYQLVQSNLRIVETDWIRSKYDYVFKQKVLDFYQGKEIRLD